LAARGGGTRSSSSESSRSTITSAGAGRMAAAAARGTSVRCVRAQEERGRSAGVRALRRVCEQRPPPKRARPHQRRSTQPPARRGVPLRHVHRVCVALSCVRACLLARRGRAWCSEGHNERRWHHACPPLFRCAADKLELGVAAHAYAAGVARGTVLRRSPSGARRARVRRESARCVGARRRACSCAACRSAAAGRGSSWHI
jgi:hypothetical protein